MTLPMFHAIALFSLAWWPAPLAVPRTLLGSAHTSLPRSAIRMTTYPHDADEAEVDGHIGSFQAEVDSMGGYALLPPYAQKLLVEKAQRTITITRGALRTRVAEVAKTKQERDSLASTARAAEAANKATIALGETKHALASTTTKLERKTIEHAGSPRARHRSQISDMEKPKQDRGGPREHQANSKARRRAKRGTESRGRTIETRRRP